MFLPAALVRAFSRLMCFTGFQRWSNSKGNMTWKCDLILESFLSFSGATEGTRAGNLCGKVSLTSVVWRSVPLVPACRSSKLYWAYPHHPGLQQLTLLAVPGIPRLSVCLSLVLCPNSPGLSHKRYSSRVISPRKLLGPRYYSVHYMRHFLLKIPLRYYYFLRSSSLQIRFGLPLHPTFPRHLLMATFTPPCCIFAYLSGFSLDPELPEGRDCHGVLLVLHACGP